MYNPDHPERQASKDLIKDMWRELTLLMSAAQADDIGGYSDVEDVDARPFCRLLVRALDGTILQIDRNKIWHSGDSTSTSFTITDFSLEEETQRLAHSSWLVPTQRRLIQYRSLRIDSWRASAAELTESGFAPMRTNPTKLKKYDNGARVALTYEIDAYLRRINSADVIDAEEAEAFMAVNDKADIYELTQRFRDEFTQERGQRFRGILDIFRK